jgi:hypothetical protein
MVRRRGSRPGKTRALLGALALSLLPTAALAEASSHTSASAGLVAELFALITFVLLALIANWSARRHRARDA